MTRFHLSVGSKPIIPKADKVEVIEPIFDKPKTGVNEYAYEITKSYKNYLPYPVVILDRNNLAVEIPAQRLQGDGIRNLYVDIDIRFSNDVQIDVHSLLDNLTEDSPAELRIFKEILNNNRLEVKYGRKRITYSYRVDEYLLKRNEFNVFLEQLDIVVCKSGMSHNVVHPFSLDGRASGMNSDSSMFTYNVIINDPDRVFGDRYININGRVYRVEVGRDTLSRPGVYIYAGGEVDYYDFDKADELVPLFPTRSLAEQLGKHNEAIKVELEEKSIKAKADLIEKERELNELRNRLQAEELKRKEEYAQLETRRKAEYENQMYQLKQQETFIKQQEYELKRQSSLEAQRLQSLKYELEMRSYERKDTSETIKWLPAIAGGILALFGLFA